MTWLEKKTIWPCCFILTFYAEGEESDLPTFASDVCMRVHAFIAPFTIIIIVLSFKEEGGERGNHGVFRSVMSGAKRNLFFFLLSGYYNISLGMDSNFSGKGKRLGWFEYLWVVFVFYPVMDDGLGWAGYN